MSKLSILFYRTMLVGEGLFKQQIDLEILNLQWFPGSPTDSHIIVLTNDNCLRFVYIYVYILLLDVIMWIIP